MPANITPPTTQPSRTTRTTVPSKPTTKPATSTTRAVKPALVPDRRVPAATLRPTASAPICLPEETPVAAPAVMASAADAVAAALGGTAVRLPLSDGEPQGLALRELIPRGDLRAFEVGLSKLRFEVVVPESADAPAVLARILPVMAQIPDPIRAAVRRVTIVNADAGSLTYVAELVDEKGKLAPITVKRTATDDKVATYTVSDRHGAFELVTAPDGQDAWEVAQAFHLWAMIPPALRTALKTIRVDNGPNPTDEYWAKQYNSPEFVSAATGGNGEANFWHGTKYLKEEYFLHEFGHVLGQTYSSKNELIPDGWAEAMAADNRPTTRYGENSPAEDFAESFQTYLTLSKNGRVLIADPPADLAGFAARWPRRAAILDAVFRGELRPTTNR